MATDREPSQIVRYHYSRGLYWPATRMFLVPREPDVHRRSSKVYSNSKASRSSKTSLLSTLTTSTSGSSGSASTVTQESYNRSHKHRRRRTKDNKSRRHHEANRNKSVDVFDFLVEEPVRPKVLLPIVEENGTRRQVMQAVEEEAVNIVESVSDESSDSETDNEQGGRNAAAAIAKSPRRDVREVSSEDEEHEKHIEHDEDQHERADDDDEDDAVIISPPAELEYMHKVNRPQLHISINGNDIVDHEPEGYYRSMSDSGISMGSSGSFQHPLPIVHEEPDSRPSSRNKYQNELALIDPRWHWPALSPQPPHDGYIPPPCPQPPPAAIMYEVPVYNPYPYPYPPTPYSTPPPPMPEPYVREPLEIREPKGQRNKPSYFRSFGRMNSRLLLRMEDDLADLEEELRQVEEEIDIAEHDSDHSTSSSGSVIKELKLREAEIYTEFHAKLDDYYHALEMKQKVDEISSPAKLSDLPKHRQWLESRILQPDRIRRLINNDLRKFSPKRQAIEIDQTQKTTTIQEPVFHPQYLAYTAFINGVLPLIMFKFCTGVLNRLILLLTIIVIGSTVQDRFAFAFRRLRQFSCDNGAYIRARYLTALEGKTKL